MALTYLNLTNRVLKALNEVPLTSSTFADATGFHADVKDAINTAISDIWAEEDGEWPFAWFQNAAGLFVATRTYTVHPDFSVVDWDSFYVKDSRTGKTITYILRWIDYDTYREYYLTDGLNSVDNSEGLGTPTFVVRGPDNNYIVHPVPDYAYDVFYEGFQDAGTLNLYTDTTLIPDEFQQVIVDKALHYAYMFRDNLEQANLAEARYQTGLAKMRRKLIPQPNTLRFDG